MVIPLHQPYEVLCFYVPSLHVLYCRTVFQTLVEQMAACFHPSALCHILRIYSCIAKWLHYFFEHSHCSWFRLRDESTDNWPPPFFTVLTNWLLGRFVLRVYLQFHWWASQNRTPENLKWRDIVLVQNLLKKSLF